MRKPRRRGRRRLATALVGTLVAGIPLAQATTTAAFAAEPVTTAVDPKIDLRVLVVSDGSAMVNAYRDRLVREGIPHEVLDLHAADRPVLGEDFLTTPDPEAPHSRFQGVIMPSSAPPQLSGAELDALHDHQARFGVRQISAYVWPGAALGMNAPVYSGSVDGMSGTVTAEAGAQGYGYLAGPVPLDDVDAAVTESYGYLATPAGAPGVTVTPLVTTSIPGSSEQGVLSAVFDDGSRQELFNTFASNQHQQHFQVLGHGQLEWLTRGVRLGEYGNYFSVHSDDVLMADSLWNMEGNCTYGDDCDEALYPSDAPGTTVRMEPSDVNFQRSWEQTWGFQIDVTFNGAGTAEYLEGTGSKNDPLLNAFTRNASAFRWINHTYSHPYLGCEKVYGALGAWDCATNPDGSIVWVPQATITQEIDRNKSFAAAHGIRPEPNSLVTGEHSGLMSLPKVPQDNPNLAPALSATAVQWIASDASREKEQRAVGPALTVPRHPMNIFYNTATREQAVDEYNWIYTSRADGGSGLCEDNPATSTCIAPLPTATGFGDYIVPIETRIALGHVVNNDPRPHYVHQSNQTQDRIVYPVLEKVIGAYRSTFAPNTPLINPTMAQAGAELREQGTWGAERDATATYWKGQVHISATGDGAQVPVSMPDGTTHGGAALPGTYAGKDTGRFDVASGGAVVLSVGRVPWGTAAPTVLEAPQEPSAESVPEGPSTTELLPEEPVTVPEPKVKPKRQAALVG